MLGNHRLNPKKPAERCIVGALFGSIECGLIEPSRRDDHSLDRTNAIERDMLQRASHAIAHEQGPDNHCARDC
ncbi:MAG: hypothetical protein ACKOAH_09200, partial [Pirellula sp.]